MLRSAAKTLAATRDSIRWRLPPDAAYGLTYARTRRFLAQTEFWARERLEEYQTKQLRALLIHCANHVPYYRDLFRKLRFDPHMLVHPRDLEALPFLDKDVVRANADRLLADNVARARLSYGVSGGTTGPPLRLPNLHGGPGRELAFMHTIWKRIGFQPTDHRAMLRGIPAPEPPHWFYDRQERAHVYSNFYLTAETASVFTQAMLEHGDPFLHSYPSSVALFARYVQEQGLELPRFKAVLLSSENLSDGQRKLVESVFGTRLYPWYGQSENVILAAPCEQSDAYHILPEYGVAEVIAADGEPVHDEGAAGELVGTTLYNQAMPLVRYRTGDQGVRGARGMCGCGRDHDLLSRITGRRFDDVVVGRENNLIPLTALDPYSPSFERVMQIQFQQERPGEVELRVVPREGFSDGDAKSIRAAAHELVGGSLDVHLRLCDGISLTERGKHPLLVQKLSIDRTRQLEQPVAGRDR